MSVTRRGFASMDPDRRRAVASMGGKTTAASYDMQEIGRQGGRKTAERGSEYFSRIGAMGGRAGKRGKAKE